MRAVKLFQIAYSERSLAEVGPGYDVLDNRTDSDPGWREYWPIRKYLLAHELDADGYIGFFSPKFAAKTGLSHADVVRFVQAAPADTEVVTFSPQPDMGSMFLNVFEQNELFDPGFTAATDAFLQSIGIEVDLGRLVMDSRHVVFSNFIVARPRFWTRWLEINEALFAVCEGPDSPLRRMLATATTYPGAVERKVFLMERIASLVLALDATLVVKPYNTFQCAWSATRLGSHTLEAVLSDALKIAMREQGFPEYTAAFAQIRDRLRQAPAL
jgi:hypothetical protein